MLFCIHDKRLGECRDVMCLAFYECRIEERAKVEREIAQWVRDQFDWDLRILDLADDIERGKYRKGR